MGTPEGHFPAAPGSIYFRTDSNLTGVSGIYRKPYGSGTNSTGWKSDQQSNAVLTPEGGLAVWMTNKTGAPSVYGNLVTSGSAAGSVVLVTAGVPNTIGVIYTPGIADGGQVLVVVSGIADVLVVDSTAVVVGYWAGSSETVNGRAELRSSLPDNSGTGITIHNREIGHVISAADAGTDVLARVVLHFN
jgi:hypothetical protein